MGCEVTWKLLWAGARAAACGGCRARGQRGRKPRDAGAWPSSVQECVGHARWGTGVTSFLVGMLSAWCHFRGGGTTRGPQALTAATALAAKASGCCVRVRLMSACLGHPWLSRTCRDWTEHRWPRDSSWKCLFF